VAIACQNYKFIDCNALCVVSFGGRDVL